MMRSFLLFIFLLLVTSGCTIYHIDSQETSGYYYPSKGSASEVIYLENINQPHKIIGYVTVNAERRQSLSEILAKMKREAAIIGADAITEIKTDSTGTWKKFPAQNVIGNAYLRANFTATAVVFK